MKIKARSNPLVHGSSPCGPTKKAKSQPRSGLAFLFALTMLPQSEHRLILRIDTGLDRDEQCHDVR